MQTVKALRQMRQGLCPKISEEDFELLFRRMSPVQTPYWCCPGSPPELKWRTDFDSAALCFQKRTAREIVKGRFQGGKIAYVFADELPLFAALYQSKGGPSQAGTELLEILSREGPMSVRMLKELTGCPVKEITTELHRLQRKFLVFEDQADSEWDRCWYRMEEVFPNLQAEKPEFSKALETVILRFAWLHVVTTLENLTSFYELPARKLQGAPREPRGQWNLILYREGLALAEDLPLLNGPELEPAPGVAVLNRNDFLVRANEYWLKEVYRYPGWEALQYLYIDGAFGGVTVGKFHNGPFEIEDILLHIPPEEWEKRKEEILAAVALENPSVRPRHYCGKPL